MSALAFSFVALVLVGPIPAVLARAQWPLRAPRAAVVLWQAVAVAAVLSAFSAGIAIASRLLMPGPDGRPTATVFGDIDRLGRPLWALYLAVLALTVLVGARLTVAVLQVAIASRRRRAQHRMLVDLLGITHDAAPAGRISDLRILEVAQPLAYCVPGVRSRVVLSAGTLTSLTDTEVAAILSHERAHLRARHDLVLEAFTAVHTAFPRFVRSASALDAVRLLVELLADDAAVRGRAHSPGPRLGDLRFRAHARGRTGCRRTQHGDADTPTLGAGQQPDAGRCCLRLRRGGAAGAHCRAGGTVADRTAAVVRRVAAKTVKSVGEPDI